MGKFLSILLALCLWMGSGPLVAQKPEKPKKEKGGGKTTGAGGESGDKAGVNPAVKQKIDYLFIEGNTQYLQGNKAEAITMFKEILEIDANHHASMYNIARIYGEMGDFENARRYGEMALEKNNENYWYYTELVRAYEQLHLLDKALSTQEALVKRFPEEKNALYDLAQLYIAKKQYQNALDTYTRLEKLTGLNEEIIYRKHQLYVFLNQPEKALLELDRLVKANPTETRYHQGRYDIYMMMGQEDKALVVLEDLARLNPNDGFALLSLADHFKSKGQMEKSDEYLFKAFENSDVDLEAKVKILSGLYSMAEQDKSLQPRLEKLAALLEKAHPGSPLVTGIRGDVFQAAGKADSARIYYLASVKADPSNEQVWQELLFMDSEAGDFKLLRKDAENALEYFPNQVAFLYFFGLGASRTGEDEEARYAFEKIKKISSANKDIRLQALLSLGELYQKAGDITKSDENFEAALAMDRENPLVLNNYAYFLSLRNARLAEAETMVLKALKAQPNSGAYQDTYGWILFLKGDLEGARTWIGKALENGGGAEVMEHYGDVLMKLGNVEEAKSWWQKALDQGATNFSISDKLKTAGNQ